MQAEESLGSTQRARQAADRQARGIGREPGLRGQRRLDLAQQRLLQRAVLGHAFDGEIAGGEIGIAVGRPHRRRDRGRRVRAKPAATHLPLELRDQARVAGGRRCAVAADQHHLDPGHRSNLGDAESHQAGADDGDATNGGAHR